MCSDLALCRLFSGILDSPVSQGAAQVEFDASGEWRPLQGAAAAEGMSATGPGHWAWTRPLLT